MTTGKLFFGGALAALGLVLACSSTTSGGIANGNADGGGSPGNPGNPAGDAGPAGPGSPADSLICSATKACPSGEFCFNGICAYGCTADGNCASNQYCDTAFTKTCQNKAAPPGCTKDGDCATNQVCVSGLCSVVPAETPACTPPAGANDGCDAKSVCLAGRQGRANSCLTFPACGQDGSCPIGTTGAVCNDGYLQGKGRFCIPAMCKDAKNCPSASSCVPVATGAPLGQCSTGGTGQACDAMHACLAGLTCQSAPGFAGACLPGVPGFDAGF